jgi:hypothetical protein
MKDMQAMATPQQQMQQPQDMMKIFMSEKESLDLVVHNWQLDNIEERVVAMLIKSSMITSPETKKVQ